MRSVQNRKLVQKAYDEIRQDALWARAKKEAMLPKEKWLRDVVPGLKEGATASSYEEDYHNLIKGLDEMIKAPEQYRIRYMAEPAWLYKIKTYFRGLFKGDG